MDEASRLGSSLNISDLLPPCPKLLSPPHSTPPRPSTLSPLPRFFQTCCQGRKLTEMGDGGSTKPGGPPLPLPTLWECAYTRVCTGYANLCVSTAFIIGACVFLWVCPSVCICLHLCVCACVYQCMHEFQNSAIQRTVVLFSPQAGTCLEMCTIAGSQHSKVLAHGLSPSS